jgi:uncharacterized membrane protein YeaQ/YmgE (transglycosylase-associated protein family)
MSLIGWLVVGLLAGGLAGRAMGTERRGCIATIVIGVIGAFIGGGVYRLVRGSDAEVFDEFDLGSIVVAFLGACALLLVLQAIGGGSKGRRR